MNRPRFPVTLETFANYQNELAGRVLTDCEHSVMEAWVPVFNDCYEDGKAEERGALHEILVRLDTNIEAEAPDSDLAQILKKIKLWVVYAWNQGRQDAGKAVAV